MFTKIIIVTKVSCGNKCYNNARVCKMVTITHSRILFYNPGLYYVQLALFVDLCFKHCLLYTWRVS